MLELKQQLASDAAQKTILLLMQRLLEPTLLPHYTASIVKELHNIVELR